MKYYILAFCLLISPAFAGDLPDRKYTPGDYDPTILLEKLCQDHYDKQPGVRHVTAQEKRDVYKNYGFYHPTKEDIHTHEVDHLIPIILGGKNTEANLWVQSYTSKWNAHVKDELEVKLHKLTCNKVIPLNQAQEELKNVDWITLYKKYVSSGNY